LEERPGFVKELIKWSIQNIHSEKQVKTGDWKSGYYQMTAIWDTGTEENTAGISNGLK
jgi:hypothetical protein